MTENRWGLTIPLGGVPLAAHPALFAQLADLGYTDVWSAEATGTDGVVPLALAVPERRLRLGTAILPAFTRGPALLAQTAATLADAAPGRFVLGLGTSSDVIVSNWNSVPFERPYQRMLDTVRFLRRALAGEKITDTYPTFAVAGFRLGVLPAVPPPIMVAALRPKMLALAGREADGAILNWLSAGDCGTVIPYVREENPAAAIAARIFVLVHDDPATARPMLKKMISGYLTVPVYRRFQVWLGREKALAGLWEAWAAGDRKAAVEAVPDEVVDELCVHGTLEQCRAGVRRYVEQGVDIPIIALLNGGEGVSTLLAGLAPPT
jgi:probable F420-dependent oxidoreductase